MPLSPESIYLQNIDKQRIVITGSGKGIITGLIVHVLKSCGRKFDYVIDNQVYPHSSYAPVIIIEAAEPTPAYKHHIGVLSAIKDHSPDAYRVFADATPKGGTLVFAEGDPKAKAIASVERPDVQCIPYKAYKHEVKNGTTNLISTENESYSLRISGIENLESLSAAKEVLKKIGISSIQFYKAIGDFK